MNSTRNAKKRTFGPARFKPWTVPLIEKLCQLNLYRFSGIIIHSHYDVEGNAISATCSCGHRVTNMSIHRFVGLIKGNGYGPCEICNPVLETRKRSQYTQRAVVKDRIVGFELNDVFEGDDSDSESDSDANDEGNLEDFVVGDDRDLN